MLVSFQGETTDPQHQGQWCFLQYRPVKQILSPPEEMKCIMASSSERETHQGCFVWTGVHLKLQWIFKSLDTRKRLQRIKLLDCVFTSALLAVNNMVLYLKKKSGAETEQVTVEDTIHYCFYTADVLICDYRKSAAETVSDSADKTNDANKSAGARYP